MNLMKCNNGHFYDGDKYASCPHCAGGGDYSDSAFAPNPGPTPSMSAGYAGGAEDIATVPGSVAGAASFPPPGSGFPTAPTMPGNQAYQTSPEVDWGKDEDEDTVTQGAGYTFKPVVGWLVVKSGEEKGRSKVLSAGKNFIGRDSQMDVVLSGDKSISRIKHAIIIYEPNSRRFIAMPGESHELFYVNDEPVLTNIGLSAYDVIKIGKTELIFVPFCGDNFVWEEE